VSPKRNEVVDQAPSKAKMMAQGRAYKKPLINTPLMRRALGDNCFENKTLGGKVMSLPFITPV